MPASSRPFRSALIRDEGSTRSAPPSTPMSLSADGWMQVASFIVCGWLLLGFSAALCQLAETRAAPAWAPVVFGVMGFGLIAAGAFKIDPTTSGPASLHPASSSGWRCSPDRPGWWFTLSSYGAHYP